MAAAIAYGVQSYGATVGLMDADVYGPSIPHLVGATGRPMAQGERIQPIEAGGLRLMSMGFLLEPDRAVPAIHTHQPDLVFLTSPNNPTGAALAPGVIEAVCAAAPSGHSIKIARTQPPISARLVTTAASLWGPSAAG